MDVPTHIPPLPPQVPGVDPNLYVPPPPSSVPDVDLPTYAPPPPSSVPDVDLPTYAPPPPSSVPDVDLPPPVPTMRVLNPDMTPSPSSVPDVDLPPPVPTMRDLNPDMTPSPSSVPDVDLPPPPPTSIPDVNPDMTPWPTLGTISIPPPRHKTGLLIAVSVSSVCLLLVLGTLIWFYFRRQRQKEEQMSQQVRERSKEEGHFFDNDQAMNDAFEKGVGPRRFCYGELAIASGNFALENKLGQGGFGSVYKGFLKEEKIHVAIKRITQGSQQGRKEYISEIRIIGNLSHKNLVKLVGWCHAGRELLLVYEFMPNASLDKHLHGSNNSVLPWTDRYKISLGLGSALLYLHQEWEQCVLHRDVKPSNIVLDAEFSAKLGDFGLARLVEKGRRSLTTALAGTMGYIDPQCAYTGRTDTMSDVYSFGVVLLEIASGKKPGVVDAQEEYAIPLSQWVWERFGSGNILDAVDERLRGQFDDQEAERVLIVGLSCCQLDRSLRPSIRGAVSVLLFESPLPVLPARMPVAVYMPMVGTSAATGSSGDSIATSKELDGSVWM